MEAAAAVSRPVLLLRLSRVNKCLINLQEHCKHHSLNLTGAPNANRPQSINGEEAELFEIYRVSIFLEHNHEKLYTDLCATPINFIVTAKLNTVRMYFENQLFTV